MSDSPNTYQVCHVCGYSRKGLSGVCPECGTRPLAENPIDHTAVSNRRNRLWLFLLLSALFLGSCVGLLLIAKR